MMMSCLISCLVLMSKDLRGRAACTILLLRRHAGAGAGGGVADLQQKLSQSQTLFNMYRFLSEDRNECHCLY